MIGWVRSHPLPMLVARLVLGGVYVWFGWNKVVEPVAFLKALRDYDLLPVAPPQALNLTVVVLPWIEILCGGLLLVGAWLRAAGALLLGLTAVFTVALTLRAGELAEAAGLGLCAVRFDCGCGVGEVWFCPKLAENVGLLALAVVAVVSRSRRLSVEGLVAPRN